MLSQLTFKTGIYGVMEERELLTELYLECNLDYHMT